MKVVKRIGIGILLVILLLGVGITLFVSLAPQFGQAPKGADLNRIEQSKNYADGAFQNLIETSMDMELSKMPGLMKTFLNPPKGKNPMKPLPTKWERQPQQNDSLTYVTWFGHSAVLLELEGKVILLDPMLGPSSAPVSFMTQRFTYAEPIELDALPDIDAIIISHDHYDHLDYPTVVALKSKTKHFYTALGVGSHLKHWGVSEDKITELDWWQEADMEGVKITATPARHFSGRGILDRNKTQWASWCVRGTNSNIYFSGDGGYGPHFKEIGERMGPFDLAFIECGQYNKMWAAIHMMPEQSVDAGLDVKGAMLMPIHWGAFDLAPHVWQDPIVRFTAKAQSNQVPYITPYIGQRFSIEKDMPQPTWWTE